MMVMLILVRGEGSIYEVFELLHFVIGYFLELLLDLLAVLFRGLLVVLILEYVCLICILFRDN